MVASRYTDPGLVVFLQRVDDLVELVVVRVPVDGDGHGDADPGLAGQLDERGDSLDTVAQDTSLYFALLLQKLLSYFKSSPSPRTRPGRPRC